MWGVTIARRCMAAGPRRQSALGLEPCAELRDGRDVATPAGQFRPWRLIWTFIGITVVLYGLVFFTPGSNTPKLGIDLQGGTRITLTARTLDGSDPTRDQMQQARTIMESRVNGSGVVGAEVQIDGASSW